MNPQPDKSTAKNPAAHDVPDGLDAATTQKLEYVKLQYQQKIQQANEATKLYFQALFVLAMTAAVAVTALSNLKSEERKPDAPISARVESKPEERQEAPHGTAFHVARPEAARSPVALLVFCGTPYFLIAWFGCYLFMYWEHHMLRVSLDHSEQTAADILQIPARDTFLFHEDFLGVFNQAWWLVPAPKLVHVVFVAIGLPAACLYLYCGLEGHSLIQQPVIHYFYSLGLIVLPPVLIAVHAFCVWRERKLKKRLGLRCKWDEDWRKW